MKLNIPIEIVFDDVHSVIDELGKLQKYKLCEGDDMTLVDVDDVADVLTRHVKAKEAKRYTHWIPCSERLPSKSDHKDNMVLVCYGNGSVRFNTYMNGWMQGNPIAWMQLPKPYGGESDEVD